MSDFTDQTTLDQFLSSVRELHSKMKTSGAKDIETRQNPGTNKELVNKDTNTEEISISEEEFQALKQKAELYDEIQKKCEELEKEIGELQIKYAISEEEMIKIDQEVRKEIEEQKTVNIDKVTTEETKKAQEPIHPEPKSKEASVTMNIEGFVLDKENKTVPGEWKVWKSKSDKRRTFQSPEGFTFTSRSDALQFMINAKYPEHFLTLMRNHLSDEGWYNDKSCPSRWKLRKIGIRDYEYLSPNMDIKHSMAEMMKYLQSQVPINSKAITNLEKKINSLQSKSDSKSVPPEAQNNEKTQSSGRSKNKVGEGRETKMSQSDGKVDQGDNKPREEKTETKAKSEESAKKSLEEQFKLCMFPDVDKLAEIGKNVGKSIEEVKTWFLRRASEESRRRQKDPPQEDKSKANIKKSAKSFKELTDQQKAALEDVLRSNPSPSEDILNQLVTQHLIEKKLVLKWFRLKSQQKAPPK